MIHFLYAFIINLVQTSLSIRFCCNCCFVFGFFCTPAAIILSNHQLLNSVGFGVCKAGVVSRRQKAAQKAAPRARSWGRLQRGCAGGSVPSALPAGGPRERCVCTGPGARKRGCGSRSGAGPPWRWEAAAPLPWRRADGSRAVRPGGGSADTLLCSLTVCEGGLWTGGKRALCTGQ